MGSKASLNHVYRTVWNRALGAMVAVAENTSSHGGGGSASLTSVGGSYRAAPLALTLAIALAWSGGITDAHANPQGGVSTVGSHTTTTNGNQLTVTTTNGAGTNHSAINWQSFSIPAGSSTYFQQPSAASTSINRVVTNTPSLIFGTLGSNGNLVLINQSGITVGAGAVVDTAGFTASALRMSDSDALSGRMRFGDGTAAGSVSVQGSILARSGDVVLLAGAIDTGKDALIHAPNGSTLLAAGQQIEITGRGLEGISLQVQAPADSVVNLGSLKGDAVGIFAGTLKHSGVIQATAVTTEGGKVVLKAADKLSIDGGVQAAALGQKGGSIHASAKHVKLDSTALLDASGALGGGEVLVGGGYQGNDARIANAQTTDVAAGAQLKADAITQGDGGTVVVWADGATRYLGSLSARGGALGGNGGVAEVSGKQYLDFRGVADLRAFNGGTRGNLLLDPEDIIIGSSDNFNGYGGGVFSDLSDASSYAGVMSYVDHTTIENLLTTTDVTLAATNDIRVQESISTTGADPETHATTKLKLDAGHDIVFTSSDLSIGSNTHALNIELIAGNSIAGTGSYGGTIYAYGGSVTMTAGIGGIGAAEYGGTLDVGYSEYPNSRAGSVLATATNGAIRMGNIYSDGNVSLNATGSAGDVTLAGNIDIYGSDSSVSLNAGRDIVFAGSRHAIGSSSNAVNVSLSAGNAIAGFGSDGASIYSNGGSISVTAGAGGVGYGATLDLDSSTYNYSPAGNITIASGGLVNTGALSANSESDSAGNITIAAGGIVTTGAITAIGYGGAVVSISGSEVNTGAIFVDGRDGDYWPVNGSNGGSVTITASGAVNVGEGGISASGGSGYYSDVSDGGAGGSVTVNAGAAANLGAINVSGGMSGSGGSGGRGGSVNVSASGTVSINGIDAAGRGGSEPQGLTNGGNGGSVAVAGGYGSYIGAVYVGGGYGDYGGATGSGGSVSVTLSSGDIVHGAYGGDVTINGASSIALAALNGAISGSGMSAGSLSTLSKTGTSLSGNSVSVFSGTVTGSGDLVFYNNASANPNALTVLDVSVANGNVLLDNYGGITTTAKISASGTVDIQAHSPLTIGAGGITAGGGVILGASTDLTLNGVIQSTGAGVSFNAGGNLVQNSGVIAAGGVSATAGGSISFGANGYSSGNPLSYSDVNGAVTVPLGPLSAAVNPGGTVADFLDQFLAALDEQQSFSDDPFDPRNRNRDGLVVEGQVCTP